MKRKIRLTENELTNLIEKIIKEQQESDYIDVTQTFASKNVQAPESCKPKIENDQPSVDYEKCLQDTMGLPFKDAVGILADLTNQLQGKAEIKTQQFDLPIGENYKRRYKRR